MLNSSSLKGTQDIFWFSPCFPAGRTLFLVWSQWYKGYINHSCVSVKFSHCINIFPNFEFSAWTSNLGEHQYKLYWSMFAFQVMLTKLLPHLIPESAHLPQPGLCTTGVHYSYWWRGHIRVLKTTGWLYKGRRIGKPWRRNEKLFTVRIAVMDNVRSKLGFHSQVLSLQTSELSTDTEAQLLFYISYNRRLSQASIVHVH